MISRRQEESYMMYSSSCPPPPPPMSPLLDMYMYIVPYAHVQGEYEMEGVDVTRVGYEDNRPLLELLLTVSG